MKLKIFMIFFMVVFYNNSMELPEDIIESSEYMDEQTLAACVSEFFDKYDSRDQVNQAPLLPNIISDDLPPVNTDQKFFSQVKLENVSTQSVSVSSGQQACRENAMKGYIVTCYNHDCNTKIISRKLSELIRGMLSHLYSKSHNPEAYKNIKELILQKSHQKGSKIVLKCPLKCGKVFQSDTVAGLIRYVKTHRYTTRTHNSSEYNLIEGYVNRHAQEVKY